MKTKVVEYLGLPASGKSWQLLNDGYCKNKNAVAHSVPLGGGKIKTINTIKGTLHNLKLSFLLYRIAILICSQDKSKFLLRPFFVIPERYGRILYLRKTDYSEVHVDEGVFQFIWRVFSEQENSHKNLLLLEKCISLLNLKEHSIAYVSCPKEKHISQVIERKKVNSNFDAGVVNGDDQTYIRGRYWMSQVLKILRKYNFEIDFIWNK
tara:strand:- start:4772 stop:5395 length:624 start_codon:yes stop_codon:yes gene_type:complete